jgi:hypothetical protein
MSFLFGGGGAKPAPPPPPPAPPPNPPTYASAAAAPGRTAAPIGGLSTILTSPAGTTAPYSTSKKALLGG